MIAGANGRKPSRNLILRFSFRASLRSQIENDPRNHFYIINSSFKDRNLFQNEFIARGVTPVAFGTLKPDFIEIWKRTVNGKLTIEYKEMKLKLEAGQFCLLPAALERVTVTTETQVDFLQIQSGTAG